MYINFKDENPSIKNTRSIVYRKSTCDGGALAMMCGKDEEP
jgi:hypothetical protein